MYGARARQFTPRLNYADYTITRIITETVFQWPGMGQLFIQSVQFADIPVMAAYLVMVSFIFVIINFCVDLLYAVIDPRLRLDRALLGTTGG